MNDSIEKYGDNSCQEMSDVVESLKSQYKRYVRNKLILGLLQESARGLKNELGDKVQNIIVGFKLKQCLQLDDNVALDVNLENFKLNHKESEELNCVLQRSIIDSRIRIFNGFKKITLKDLKQAYEILPPTVSLFNPSLIDNEDVCLSYRKKLSEEQISLKKSISERSNLMENLINMRLVDVPKQCDKASEECKLLIECNYLKSKIVEYKTKVDIFLEIPIALNAYKELLKDIECQKKETELAIEKMRESRNKYESVSGKEYNQILQSYLMYTNSINKLNKMYAIVN